MLQGPRVHRKERFRNQETDPEPVPANLQPGVQRSQSAGAGRTDGFDKGERLVIITDRGREVLDEVLRPAK